MKELTLKQAAEDCRGTLTPEQAEGMITGVQIDSRRVKPGDLFVAIKGEKSDGHDFIGMAASLGASAALVQRPVKAAIPTILVPDTIKAYGDLAAARRERMGMTVIGITGSVGKTTTKEMTACMLERTYRTARTEGNHNNNIGLPMTILDMPDDTETAVLELGMNHFGEMARLTSIAKPDIAVITNVGDAHIENLGNTRQGILQAKCEIFDNLTPEGVAVLNGDDELLNTVTLPQIILRCGEGEHCDVRVTDIDDRGLEGMACTVTTGQAAYRLETAAPGRHMVYPMAMAAAIGERLGLTAAEITAGTAAYAPVGSRMHLIRMDGDRLVIDDCYNANPQSMAEGIRMLAASRQKKRLAVLGDMGELGALTAQAHRDMGTLCRELGIETVAVGEKMKALTETDPEAQWFAGVEEAMPAVRARFTPGTAVLVKASRAMHFENIVKELEKE